MDVGLIGLGKMGGSIADRLRRQGRRVVSFDFNPAAVRKLSKPGSVGGLRGHRSEYFHAGDYRIIIIAAQNSLARGQQLYRPHAAVMRSAFGGHAVESN